MRGKREAKTKPPHRQHSYQVTGTVCCLKEQVSLKRFFCLPSLFFLWRLASAVIVSVVVVFFMASCSDNNASSPKNNGAGNKMYVADHGAVTEYAPHQRNELGAQFEGVLVDGSRLEAQQLRGQVTVLNFWYAACAPCRKEAPDLEASHQNFKDQGVAMVGVNIRDEAATAAAFMENFGISYPNFVDKDGAIVRSLSQFLPGRAVPTTLILDRQGRLAARVLGAVDSSTLKSLISAVVRE